MFQLTQSKLFFPTSYKYTLFGNEYFVEIMIPHSRSILVSSKGWVYVIRKENKPSKGSQIAQKDDLSRRVITRKMFLMKYLTLIAYSTRFKDQVQKSNMM